MDYPIPISLRRDLFHAICERCGEGYFGDQAQAALEAALMAWLAAPKVKASHSNASPSGIAGGAPHAVATVTDAPDGAAETASHRGYQWKRLFLPDGTQLRAAFRGHTRYATVDGEHIVCDGQPLTPSAFANLNGCGQRNAWHAIWLRFPGELDWRRAQDCRPGRA